MEACMSVEQHAGAGELHLQIGRYTTESSHHIPDAVKLHSIQHDRIFLRADMGRFRLTDGHLMWTVNRTRTFIHKNAANCTDSKHKLEFTLTAQGDMESCYMPLSMCNDPSRKECICDHVPPQS